LYYNTLTGSNVLNPNRFNGLDYQENVLAVYVSGNTNLSETKKMQLGLRLEDTKTKGINSNMNKETNTNYTKLFPSFYLSYAKNENNTFGFSYGRRIDRPHFRNLNPFNRSIFF